MTENRQVMLMQKARASGMIDTFELTCLLWGRDVITSINVDNVEKRRAAFERVEKQLRTYDIDKLPCCYAETSREALYEQGLRMGKACLEDMQKHDHELFVWMTPRYSLTNASPFGHKSILFEPAIEHNGTEEQRAKWLSLAKPGNILGTYAQTELGHGSFVRGLETTATFDEKTDEFVLYSPTIRSTKFWPAGLGFSTTHAVVMAQLVVNAKKLGPHLFIVQIRSEKDGKPMPGIRMGDVGLKMGFNEADNGFATFTHVRIPRTHMLMAHSQLSSEGVYTSDPLRAKLSYSVMLLVRSHMPRVFTLQLAQALTIATRYSSVREQGQSPHPSEHETTIITYPHQTFGLITMLAKAYALYFSSLAVESFYDVVREEQAQNNHTNLPSLHALTAGLKAYTTSEALDGAEECRKMCGGHGYMVISGLPEIIGACAGACTFEGENMVMWLQVGRYLLKTFEKIAKGEEVDEEVSYLTRGVDPHTPCAAERDAFLDEDVQLEIYRSRAHRLTICLRDARDDQILMISAARAHIELSILRSFTTIIASLPSVTSPTLLSTLANLRSLFALSTIINPRTIDAQSFLTTHSSSPYLSSAQLDAIRGHVNNLLTTLLPESIRLTDAWGFSDASLGSALGCSDGDVYGRIMKWVGEMPINKNVDDIHAGWGEFMGAIVKAKL